MRESPDSRRGKFRRLIRSSLLLVLAAGFVTGLPAQQIQPSAPADSATNTTLKTPEEQLAASQLELTNAWQRVIRIVNQPVRAYVRSTDVPVRVFSPGWFHEGAIKPDFDNVDVRATQELIYPNEYVTSDLNPGVMFMGRDLAFNSMTKYFYVNRSLPKHRLTQAEMVEINRLYRIIGRCQKEIHRLQHPLEAAAPAATADANVETADQPDQPLAAIRKIPREKRLLYGGIAIGSLVGLAVLLRLGRRNSE